MILWWDWERTCHVLLMHQRSVCLGLSSDLLERLHGPGSAHGYTTTVVLCPLLMASALNPLPLAVCSGQVTAWRVDLGGKPGGVGACLCRGPCGYTNLSVVTHSQFSRISRRLPALRLGRSHGLRVCREV